jgi:hypothetical protein
MRQGAPTKAELNPSFASTVTWDLIVGSLPYQRAPLREQIEALRHMTVGQLKDKYRDVFGEATRSN